MKKLQYIKIGQYTDTKKYYIGQLHDVIFDKANNGYQYSYTIVKEDIFTLKEAKHWARHFNNLISNKD
jgi:hypothetical protein